MALSEPRLLSRPHRVLFAGFESTTTTLRRAGWQLAVEQDFGRSELRLALRYEPAKLYMLAYEQRYDFMAAANPGRNHLSGECLTFDIQHCTSRMDVKLMSSSFNFQPIDAEPTMVNKPYKCIEDFGIFASPLVRTEEIIVEPQSVAECLDLIRKMQAPDLAEVRQRNLQRERQEPMNQAKFHAQILSLAA